MTREMLKCSRCKRSERSNRANDWNVTMKQGRVVGYLCNPCQTPEENAEAEINLATTRYGMDAFGRFIGFPKVAEEAS